MARAGIGCLCLSLCGACKPGHGWEGCSGACVCPTPGSERVRYGGDTPPPPPRPVYWALQPLYLCLALTQDPQTHMSREPGHSSCFLQMCRPLQ